MVYPMVDGRWYMVALGKRNDLNGDSNMGRETYLMPVTWEPAIVKWEQVSKTKWEPIKYLWPVVAPQTGKVERYTPLPFPEKIQYRNDVFIDDFDLKKLNLGNSIKIIGGKTRQDSTFKALEKVNKMKCRKVLIHDAARPFPSKNIINNIIKNLNTNHAVIPVIKNNDATKRIKKKLRIAK